MNQNEIIRSLSIRLGLTQTETKRLLKSSMEIIVDVLDQDIPITIPDLGTFSTAVSKKRKSYSPFHKQYVLLPPKRMIRFRPSSSIKNDLKSKKP